MKEALLGIGLAAAVASVIFSWFFWYTAGFAHQRLDYQVTRLAQCRMILSDIEGRADIDERIKLIQSEPVCHIHWGWGALLYATDGRWASHVGEERDKEVEP